MSESSMRDVLKKIKNSSDSVLNQTTDTSSSSDELNKVTLD
jgi:hypothetical protein